MALRLVDDGEVAAGEVGITRFAHDDPMNSRQCRVGIYGCRPSPVDRVNGETLLRGRRERGGRGGRRVCKKGGHVAGGAIGA